MASDYIWFIGKGPCLNLLEEHTGLGFAPTLSSPMSFLTMWYPGMGTENMYTTHPSGFYPLNLGPLLGAPQV